MKGFRKHKVFIKKSSEDFLFYLINMFIVNYLIFDHKITITYELQMDLVQCGFIYDI